MTTTNPRRGGRGSRPRHLLVAAGAALLLAASALTGPAALAQSDDGETAVDGGVATLSPPAPELAPLPRLAGEPVQVSEAGAVTLAVTWQGPASGLVFEVAMDTHSVDLDRYDLSQLAALHTDQGVEVLPLAWEAPRGGHHRSGSLTFPGAAPDGTPILASTVTGLHLAIRDVAGVPERSFAWALQP